MPPQTPYPQNPYPSQGQPGPSASQQRKHHSWGLIVGLILSILMLIGVAVYSYVLFNEKEKYRTQTQAIVDDEVSKAVEKTKAEKDAQFKEDEKKPLRKYQGPSTFGGLDISYPKTWSVFVTENDKSSTPIDGYFHPNHVPGTQSGTAFALRIQVTNQTYDQEMRKFDSQVKNGRVKVAAYAPKNVPGVKGSRVEGEIFRGQQDYMIVLPLRDKTIKIWTESQQFLGDFNTNILENFKFVP